MVGPVVPVFNIESVETYEFFFPSANPESSVQSFDQWATKSVSQTFPLSTLKDAVVGVDASFWLDLKINGSPKEEPLLHAHGGVPFVLKKRLKEDIKVLRSAGAKAVFIFNGLDHVNKPAPEYLEQESMKAADDAWRKYNAGNVEGVPNEFTKAKYPIQYLVRWFQGLLTKLKVEFLVAPYSSVAQLSYMQRLSEQYIDCVWGSTDYFLFNIDKVITNIVSNTEGRPTTFMWVSKAACEERLKATPDFLRDVQLLLGTAFAPTFPPLARQGAASKGAGVNEAVSMLNAHGRSVLQLCQANRDDPSMAGIDYEDIYKKAVMSLRHHIAIQHDGAIEPMNAEHAPSDVHDFVGQNLPPEMFFYLSRGIIGPEPLNWLTNDHIDLALPPGVIDSTLQRTLVFEQLNPMRAQTLMVMSEFMPNYYRNRKVQIRTWGERERPDLTIEMRDQPTLKDKVSGWKVKDPVMQGISSEFSYLKCLQALKEDSFREQTVNAAKTSHQYPALSSTDEIVVNTFYRFLHVRGYVDDKHQLTSWGQVLEAVLSKLEPIKAGIDVALLSVELMRFGLLNGSEGDGSQSKSTDKSQNVQSSINLVSKVACLAKFPHEAEPWKGPLNRRLLSFSWMVAAIRLHLRILLESVMVAMFLAGEARRDRDDWTTISDRLPLIRDQGCAFGVVAETYFDRIVNAKDNVEDAKEKLKRSEPGQSWFPYARTKDIGSIIPHIHNIWTAVYSGSQVAGKENKEAKVFDEAEKVLKPLW